MDEKDNTFIPLIVLFFALGLIIGYVIHKPEPVVRTLYINKTIEVPKMVEKTVEVTITPSTTVPTATSAADFSVKNYDSSRDKPSRTIELTDWRAVPNILNIHPGDTVLIKINDYALQSPMTLILSSSYRENIGTMGARVVTFNKNGSYNFKAIVPSSDPNIIPRTYAEGTITVS